MKSFVEQSERHYVSVPRLHLWSRIYIILCLAYVCVPCVLCLVRLCNCVFRILWLYIILLRVLVSFFYHFFSHYYYYFRMIFPCLLLFTFLSFLRFLFLSLFLILSLNDFRARSLITLSPHSHARTHAPSHTVLRTLTEFYYFFLNLLSTRTLVLV